MKTIKRLKILPSKAKKIDLRLEMFKELCLQAVLLLGKNNGVMDQVDLTILICQARLWPLPPSLVRKSFNSSLLYPLCKYISYHEIADLKSVVVYVQDLLAMTGNCVSYDADDFLIIEDYISAYS